MQALFTISVSRIIARRTQLQQYAAQAMHMITLMYNKSDCKGKGSPTTFIRDSRTEGRKMV